jgi:hypothetical protein
MHCLVSVGMIAGLSLGCIHDREASVIEAAPAGRPYDYIVHVRMSYDYGYNPEVSTDRIRLARRTIRPYCRHSQVVGEEAIQTEILGITSSPPDRVVYLKC